MSITNLVPVLLIFIYLIIIFLIDYYKNICFNNEKINKTINIENINPTLALYCYKSGNIKKLFNITILNLINNGYYELVRKKGNTYISSTTKTGKLLGFEEIIKNYIDEILDNKKLNINDFNEKLILDYKYLAKTNKFYEELKKEAHNQYGTLDFVSDYMYSFFAGILYFMQIAFFVYNDFSFSHIVIISIPLSLINILLCDKIKDNILKIEKKKIIFLVLISIILSIISCLIWILFNSSNYILFHFMVGILSFMYPLFVFMSIYFIKTNVICFNKKQKRIKKSLDILKNEMIDNNELKEKYYMYTKIFKIKHKYKENTINDFFEYMF